MLVARQGYAPDECKGHRRRAPYTSQPYGRGILAQDQAAIGEAGQKEEAQQIMNNDTICAHCHLEFACVDLVHTWLGNSWAVTCAECNRKSRLDIETEKRIAGHWWRGVWFEELTWKEAVTAFRAWSSETATTASAILSTNVNTLVRLLSKTLRRDERLIMRELIERCMATDSDGPRSELASTAGSSLTPKRSLIVGELLHKTSTKWPARSGVS
jgi:hypothetical protein